MVSLNKLAGCTLVLAILCGLPGCGGGGPSAGMPDSIPDGPPKVDPAIPISTKDYQKAKASAAKSAQAGKAAEAINPAPPPADAP